MLPNCIVCIRNGQPCCYPNVQQKPGPKLGSHSAKHRKRSSWRSNPDSISHNEDIIQAPAHAATRNQRLQHSPPASFRNAGSPTGSAASSPDSTTAQSWVFHHFHEDQSYTISPFTPPETAVSKDSLGYRAPLQNNMAPIYQALGLSRQMLSTFIDTYFENMTFLSLFHRPTFDTTVYSTVELGIASALVAAMCAFAAHYMEPAQSGERDGLHAERSDSMFAPGRFYRLARATIHDQLDLCGDSRPPLALLQAYVLITFYEMTISARGRAWRSLGACVRIAHELELHLTDAMLQGRSVKEQSSLAQTGSWLRSEEQRRVWWALYELDIFASTVRRRPASIHAGEHAVLLPVSDASWFERNHQASCFLDPDPLHRTRKLLESGNTSGKAWYLVVNSLVHDAHTTTNPTAHCDRMASRQDMGTSCHSESVDERKLAVLDDFLLYFKTVLPKDLAYEGDYLAFSTSSVFGGPSASQDCDIQLIHAMLHLGKLMVFHHFCSQKNAPLPPGGEGLADCLTLKQPSVSDKLRAILGFTNDQMAWDRYLVAAEEIMRVVRNASPNHIRYGHPLLASTFWIVAATQIFKKTFATDDAAQELAQSNFDLLRLTLDHSHRFWHTSDLMVKNIDTLDTRLAELKARLTGAEQSSHGLPISSAEKATSQSKRPHFTASDQSDTMASGSPDNVLPNVSDRSGTGHYELNSGAPADIDKPNDSELHAFMYDFCGDNWDVWGQELADFFPSTVAST
ncbi:hypothetical protein A1O7_08101 [Cladophialophora yegresii CBS 114405]|uniref:Xylanolytic transcriptional activator regulatory domain-containing protein n=1 Tax=Cladophialophora yegresii CBS 114405 TaxID=1182544 RepID=W9VSL4_9EURO|nr:uncharacterized protein A1O7_08101 [Cladophialophora yegresii CBS 114405]EXJ55176.1 hypothetical protein A1O7_08101 [Cladophialophora yegresii CBS 114405]